MGGAGVFILRTNASVSLTKNSLLFPPMYITFQPNLWTSVEIRLSDNSL